MAYFPQLRYFLAYRQFMALAGIKVPACGREFDFDTLAKQIRIADPRAHCAERLFSDIQGTIGPGERSQFR
jgi:hypothetical protein